MQILHILSYTQLNMTNTTIKRFKNALNKLSIYKQKYRSNLLPEYLHQVIIGLLLSDGSLEKSSNTSSPRLSVIFGDKHVPYLLHLYNLLEPFIDNNFTLSTISNKRKHYEIVKFKTASLPLLSYYYKLFYVYDNEQERNIKIVPSNIHKIISPVVLAHLIMGDGNLKIKDNIVRIYTNSYSKNDVERLAKAICKKLDIATRVAHDRNNQYILTISKNQLYKLKKTIMPYMHPSMVYKLGEYMNEGTKFDYFNIKDII